VEYRLQKLRDSREANRENREHTPLYLVLQAVRGYHELSASWDSVQQAVEQTIRELEEILSLVPEEDDRWAELCRESALLLAEFSEASLPELEQLESEFLSLDLNECYRRLEAGKIWSQLSARLDLDIPEWELTSGHYTTVLATMEQWLEGVCPLSCLEEQKERVQRQLTEYTGLYLSPDEWTIEVAMGDQLLQEGLECWMQGLTRLCEAVAGNRPASVARGLELLLAGNYKLIQVERLAALDSSA
jgi:hypothetical protein